MQNTAHMANTRNTASFLQVYSSISISHPISSPPKETAYLVKPGKGSYTGAASKIPIPFSIRSNEPDVSHKVLTHERKPLVVFGRGITHRQVA